MKNNKKLRVAKNYFLARFFGIPKPMLLEIEMTRRCNFRCEYCRVANTSNQEIPKADIFSLVDSIQKDCCVIILSGGEPLLRQDIEEIVDYIQSKDGIFLIIVTNGSLVREKAHILKKADLVFVSVDLPGEICDLQRSEKSCEKALEGIEILNKLDVKVGLLCVLTNNNANKPFQIIESLRKMKYSFVDFIPVSEVTNLKMEELERIRPAKNDLTETLSILMRYRKELRILNSAMTIQRFMRDYPLLPHKGKCFYTKIGNYVNCEGLVQPCCAQKNVTDKDSILTKSIYTIMRERKTNCIRCPIHFNTDLADPIKIFRYII